MGRSGARKKKWNAQSLRRVDRSLERKTPVPDEPTAKSKMSSTARKFSDVGVSALEQTYSETATGNDTASELCDTELEGRPCPKEGNMYHEIVTDYMYVDAGTGTESEGEDVPEVDIDCPTGYSLLDTHQLQQLIRAAAVCRQCGGELELREDNKRRRVWASCFALVCESCDKKPTWQWMSKSTDTGAREVNKLCVLAMRAVGKGRRGAVTFAGHMNLPLPIGANSWGIHTKSWGETANDVLQEDFQRAVMKVKKKRVAEGKVPGVDPDSELCDEELQDLVMDIPVAIDGSWIRRGADSKHGFVTVISQDSGEVLDRHYMCRSCRQCERWSDDEKTSLAYLEWYVEHSTDCLMNHSGSASSMEATGATELFWRSMEKYKVRYNRYNPYIGDGDSSAFKTVCRAQPYGPDYEIRKEECVGHVQKRMGTGLRRLLDKNKGKMLSDGKPLGGRGRLTLARVNALQTFYGITLRKNAGYAESMARKTLAMLTHYGDLPTHEQRPTGPSSWCQYQADQAMGTRSYRPPAQPLAPAVVETMKPLFATLTDLELLKSCSLGATQNANEALHQVVWTVVPKAQFHSPDQIQLGIDRGALWYNRGRKETARLIFEDAELQLNVHGEKNLAWIDGGRIRGSAYKCSTPTKDARKLKRQSRAAQIDAFSKSEGPMYESGKFHATSKATKTTTRAAPKCRKCGLLRKGHPKTCPSN